MDWTVLRGLLGIADNPVSSIAISAKVINARTGTTVRTLDLGTVTSTQNPSYTTTNVTLTPLDARNCLCGRGATGSVTIDGSAVSWDYSSIRSNWGCR